MVNATLSRGSTSVDLPLVATGGNPLVAVDHGRPNLEVQTSGALDPRHSDFWSGTEQYTLLVRFTSSNAYNDAITLADLIKSNSNGTPLELSIPLPEFKNTIEVAPAAGQDESVSIVYNPGRRDWVEVDVALTRVSATFGGGDQPANTPKANGNGPITLSDGSNTVALERDITVSRGVGRPKSEIRRTSSAKYPRYTDKHKAAYDGFELSLEFGDNTTTKVTNIRDMFNQSLKRDSLTLDFNGLYNMGAFNVVPDGSNALRTVRSSGEEGTVLLPTINLRRVL